MEYKTVEGHPIKIGELYETRDSEKLFVLYLDDAIYGQKEGEVEGGCWFSDGTASDGDGNSREDIMRPWKEKKQMCKLPPIAMRGAGSTHCLNCCQEIVYQGQMCTLEEKKVYKLSEMWKAWCFCGDRVVTYIFKDEGVARERGQWLLGSNSSETLIAITRADATSFYEGEGLDG